MARIRIGPWTANPALNLLERGARSIKLEPRTMEVLLFLASRGADVVSVNELVASVWKGIVVGDGSVYLAISQLRQALDDPANGVHYIETIPKRGYRLTVPVERVEPESIAAQAVLQTPPRRLGRPVRWWLGVALILAAIFTTVAVALRYGTQPVPENSVAVLPFDNLSSDPEQEYFADGIAVELLNTLSRVRDLRVIGRTSSFHFKNRNADLRTIGAALGVEHVLEGSVRKAGDQMRITAQLSNVRTGQQLWSETYERKLDDIFVIQDEIAKSVADALQVKLGVGVGHMPGMTRNVAAYDEYLRGMALNIEARPESFPPAIAHMQRAVDLDPTFSMGWAGLNAVCANGAFVVPGRTEEWRQTGKEALERARVLTPDAPYVLLQIGISEARRGNWLEAAAIYDRLQASYAQYGMANQAWGPRGVFLLGVGRVREAIPALERARAEEPLAPAFAGFLSQASLASGNLAAALAEVDRGLALGGLETMLNRAGLVIALTKQDRVEIEKRLKAMPDIDPGARLNRRLAQFIDAPAGVAGEIRHLASAANYPEKALLAQWAAYYHEPELSLDLLAEAAPNLSLPSVLWQPQMRDVRKLPAFKEVVRRMGLVDYWRTYRWSDFCHPLSKDDFVCG